MTFNPNNLQPLGRHPETGNIVWVYVSSTDTLADIVEDGYMTAQGTGISVDDPFIVVATDGIRSIRAVSVDGTTGSVNTAGGVITPGDIVVDSANAPILPSIGGDATPTTLLEELELIHQRLNLKVQLGANLGNGASIFVGNIIDPEDPSVNTLNFRRLEAGDGIEINSDGDQITVSLAGTGGGGNTGGGGGGGSGSGDAPWPTPLYGGAYHPFSIPANIGLPTKSNSSTLLNQVYNITPGRFNLNHKKFTPAIYDEALAGNATAVLSVSSPSISNLSSGQRIPWNPNVMTTPRQFDSGDSDSYTLIVNQQTGRCIELFKSTYNSSTNVMSCVRANIIQSGTGLSGGNGDIFTKENGNTVSRGCGMPHAIGVILRSEIDAGFIPHATGLIWVNPTAFAFEAPMLKGIGANNGGGANRGFMGLRIVWSGLTSSDINNWVATKPAATRGPLQTIAKCLRDYGGFGTDHGGNASNKRGAMQMEHELTAKWSQIGIVNNNILAGLHSLLEPNKSKARVIDLPSFPGGNSGLRAEYADVDYP